MVELTIPLLAGSVSTVIFAVSTLPMLAKAAHSKDMSSYSLGHIWLANVGNLVHSVYVFSLPVGPVWVLHTFYLVSTVLMLVWYLRYETSWGRRSSHTERPTDPEHSPGQVTVARSPR